MSSFRYKRGERTQVKYFGKVVPCTVIEQRGNYLYVICDDSPLCGDINPNDEVEESTHITVIRVKLE